VRVVLIIVCFLFLGCSTKKSLETVDVHYEIINDVLKTHALENPSNKKEARLNPIFLELFPSTKFSNLEILKHTNRYKEIKYYTVRRLVVRDELRMFINCCK